MQQSASLQALLAKPGPPDLGPGPRAGVASIAQIDAALAGDAAPQARRPLIRATILLWHDHFDAAHRIVQEQENADGSYIHAILHRREPDYGNAKYWFRRVGPHACFPELAHRVEALLDRLTNPELRARLIPRNQWDPFQFVDLCEAAGAREIDAPVETLRRIQQTEFEVLLEHLHGSG